MDMDNNFLPEDYLAKKVARRTNVICVSLFVVVMAAVVGAFYVSGERWNAAIDRQAQLTGQMEDAALRLDQVSELQERKHEIIYKSALSGALVEKSPRSIILSELINFMPESMSLLEYELEAETLSVKTVPRSAIEREKMQQDKKDEPERVEVPPIELKLDLIGVANTDVDVAQFMTAMRAHTLFDAVNLVFSEQTEIEELEKRKFRIQMTINQGLDLSEFETTRIARGGPRNPMDDEVVLRGNPPGATASHPAP